MNSEMLEKEIGQNEELTEEGSLLERILDQMDLQKRPVIYTPPPLPEVKLEFAEIRKHIAPQDATDDEVKAFIEIAEHCGLDPYKREAYLIKPYKTGRAAYVTGYQVYIARAERTGLMDGWDVEMDDDEQPTKATITIHRKDFKRPFSWTVYREEVAYAAKSGGGRVERAMHKHQPRFQLMKCAISQGFRICFSAELGGYPYIAEEILNTPTTSETLDEAPSVSLDADTPAEDLETTNQPEEPEAPDPDRFRRSAFQMAEFLGIGDDQMRSECQTMFSLPLKDGNPSREGMTPGMWLEYLEHIRKGISEAELEEYELWLQVRSAIKPLVERGMDKVELVRYLQVYFLRLDVLHHNIPGDLAARLKRSNSDKRFPGLQQGAERTKEWIESVGGWEKAEDLLRNLNDAAKEAGDPVLGAQTIEGFFDRMMVKPQDDGTYHLTDIMPETLKAWRKALEAVCESLDVDFVSDDVPF